MQSPTPFTSITFFEPSGNPEDQYFGNVIAPTPLPGALPLFATGLAAMGLYRLAQKASGRLTSAARRLREGAIRSTTQAGAEGEGLRSTAHATQPQENGCDLERHAPNGRRRTTRVFLLLRVSNRSLDTALCRWSSITRKPRARRASPRPRSRSLREREQNAKVLNSKSKVLNSSRFAVGRGAELCRFYRS